MGPTSRRLLEDVACNRAPCEASAAIGGMPGAWVGVRAAGGDTARGTGRPVNGVRGGPGEAIGRAVNGVRGGPRETRLRPGEGIEAGRGEGGT
jgi:hypothetical protein